MTVEPIAPDDAPALLALAAEWGHRVWNVLGNSAGIVARDRHGVAGFVLLREAPFGIVIDEMWAYPNRRGKTALSALYRWLEHTARDMAKKRHAPMRVGGVVHAESAHMMRAMERRGYTPVASVFAKVFA